MATRWKYPSIMLPCFDALSPLCPFTEPIQALHSVHLNPS